MKKVAIILTVFLLFSLLGCSREITEEDYWEAIWERRDAGEPLINQEEAEIMEKWGFWYDPDTEELYDTSCGLPRGTYPVLLDEKLLVYDSGGLMLVLDMEKKNVVQFRMDIHYTGAWDNLVHSSENGSVVLTDTGFEIWQFGRKTEIKGSYVGEFCQDGWAYLQEGTLYIFKDGTSTLIATEVEMAGNGKECPYLVFTQKGETYYFTEGEVFPYPP